MVAGGILTINIQKFGCLEISATGREILAGNQNFEFREIPTDVARERKVSKKAAKAMVAHSSEDDELLAQLKVRRLELAKAKKVPAYVVFPDNTLIEMASKKPANLDALAMVSGVGPKKLEDYGKTFLSVINDMAMG